MKTIKLVSQKVGPCRVDGLLLQRPAVEKEWVASAENVYAAIIYEFFGCYYHVCYVCYPNRKEFNKKLWATMEELHFTIFQERFRFLQKQVDEKVTNRTTDGFYFRIERCEYVWECQFKAIVKQKPLGPENMEHLGGLTKIINKSQFFSPLKPRDSFDGGRTENFSNRWRRTREFENFRYVDICSLYPYVNANCLYPVGHPDRVLVAPFFDDDTPDQHSKNPLAASRRKLLMKHSETDRIFCQARSEVELKVSSNEHFGLIKCCVPPPRDLLIPVLPYKFNAKLLFPLCRSCVEESVLTKKVLPLTVKKVVLMIVSQNDLFGGLLLVLNWKLPWKEVNEFWMFVRYGHGVPIRDLPTFSKITFTLFWK